MTSRKICVPNFADRIFQNTDDFCRWMQKYHCAVTVRHNNIEGNAKSVLSMLSICANAGDEIEIICEGPDEKIVLKMITEMLEHGTIG